MFENHRTKTFIVYTEMDAASNQVVDTEYATRFLEISINGHAGTLVVITIVDGDQEVSKFVTIEKNEVRQDWNRFVRIAQDANNGIWYWAGRTAWNVIAVGPSGVGFQVVSDNRHWDFDDINLLMQTAINNYLRHLGLPLH